MRLDAHRNRTARRHSILAIALATSLGACSGDEGTTEPTPTEPEITIGGVEDGATYTAPVTITIEVAPGSYAARLNGEPFASGATVAEPGQYTLVVDARNGLATASRTVDFTMEASGGGSSVLIVRIIDLGQADAEISGGGGDAILLTDSSSFGMVHALVDAGGGEAPGDDERFVLDRLQQLGVDSLAFLQLSHAHSDHFAGMDELLTAIEVDRFVYNGQVRDLSFYNDVLAAADANAQTVVELDGLLGVSLGIGQAQTAVTMLPPLPTYLDNPDASGDELNEGSIGTLLERGFFTMFLAGDGEFEATDRWRLSFAEQTGELDVLKVGHHGANNATSAVWLSHASPEIAIISANGVSHPREGALDRLESLQGLNELYCTNTHGDVVIRVDAAGSYEVSVERNADQPCQAGSEATT